MNKKKLLALLMALVMTLSLLPVTALATQLVGGGDDPIVGPGPNSNFPSVVNVAQIGNQSYATVKEAIENVADGETINVIADSTENGILDGVTASNLKDKTVTITGSKKLTSTADPFGFYFGDYNKGSGNTPSDVININDITLAKDGGKYNTVFDGLTANLTNVTITGNGNTALSYANGASGTLTNVTVTNTGYYNGESKTWRDAALSVQGIGTGPSVLTVESGTYTSQYGYAVYIFSSGGTVNIKGGTFEGALCANIDRGTYNNDYNQSIINISGGTFTNVAYTFEYGGTNAAEYAKINITGGTFDADPTPYVVEGYEAVNNGNGTWTVVSANANTAVAQVGNVKYATLQAAFDAVQTGQTIELLKDIDLSDWTPIGTIGTINGSNGAPSGHTSFSGTLDGKNHTITGLTANLFNSLDSATIKDLTIDGATIHGGDCVGALAGYAYNSTISNVTVTGALDITGTHFVGGVVGYAAKTTMDNVDVNATGTISATDLTGEDGDDVGGVVGYFGPSATLVNCDVNGSGQLTISADRQAGGLAGISSAAGAITNCSVRNVTVQCTANANTNTKKAAKIAFGGLVSSFNSSCGAVTGCTVSGVTLNAAENANTTNARVGIISAGRYNKGETNVLPSISATASNNTLEISSESELKSISDEVNRGVNYAGNTVNLTSDITLQSDIDLTATVNITKDLTIDLNGHNITATNARALWVKSGNVTITGQGKISANGDSLSAGSSVIRVGDGSNQNSDRLAKASLTIGADVTIESAKCYGVSVFGVNNTGLGLTVNGAIHVTGEGGAVANNGNSWNTATTMTINGSVTSDNSYAIYHPGKGELTVNGTVTGKGGIEAKSGTVNINNGATVRATAQKQTHTANNNGTSTSGYAIAAISNTGYVGDPTVTINYSTIYGDIIMLVDGKAELNAVVKADAYYDNIPDGFTWVRDENTGEYTLTTDLYAVEPTWQWRAINGQWKAIATYETAAGSYEVEIYDAQDIEVYSGTIEYTAYDNYGHDTTKEVQRNFTVTYEQGLEQPDSAYKWGDVCPLHADVPSNWFILDGGEWVQIAAVTRTYSFAVTGNVTIRSEPATGNEEAKAIVYPTMKFTGGGKAEFQAKWSIPQGASVQSVTIYRGYTSTDKIIDADTLIAKGARFDANLNVLNGDFLLRMTGLTSGRYQHAVIVIKYREGTEVKTLTSAVGKVLVSE